MTQLHKRFSDDQVSFLLHSYSQGLLSRQEVQDTLSIGKTRFFELWKQYQTDPDSFSIAYQRRPNRRISEEVEGAIEKELLRDKELIENPEIPISTYNYSALRDRLRMQGITVSVNTIIDRAKRLGCHIPRKKRKVHDREVLTSSAGALIQHDGSTHLWSPYSKEKWTLITSIDDYSRPGQDLRPAAIRRFLHWRDHLGSYSSYQSRCRDLWVAPSLLRGLFAGFPLRARKRQLLAQACTSD